MCSISPRAKRAACCWPRTRSISPCSAPRRRPRSRRPRRRGGQTFVAEIEPGVGIVTGDPRRLGQALGNVLKNAISYTPEGGRILLRAEGDRDEARIIVSDNGAGIAPADQARVFDRFSRTVEGRTGEEAAVGLGLPLAKQFVEAHGGVDRTAVGDRRGDDGHHPSAAHRRAARRLAGAAGRRMIRS